VACSCCLPRGPRLVGVEAGTRPCLLVVRMLLLVLLALDVDFRFVCCLIAYHIICTLVATLIATLRIGVVDYKQVTPFPFSTIGYTLINYTW
jgi:hypothetical protein